MYLGSLQEQLVAIARIKCIVGARRGEENTLFRGLRSLQVELRVEKGLRMQQTHIDQFFK